MSGPQVTIRAPHGTVAQVSRELGVISVVVYGSRPELVHLQDDKISLDYVRSCRDFELAKRRDREGYDGSC